RAVYDGICPVVGVNLPPPVSSGCGGGLPYDPVISVSSVKHQTAAICPGAAPWVISRDVVAVYLEKGAMAARGKERSIYTGSGLGKLVLDHGGRFLATV